MEPTNQTTRYNDTLGDGILVAESSSLLRMIETFFRILVHVSGMQDGPSKALTF